MRVLNAILGVVFLIGCTQLGSVLARKNVKPMPNLQLVGGESTNIRSYPFMAALYLAGSLCGGSLYKSSFIITAAHCVQKKLPNISNFSVLLNSTSIRGTQGYILASVRNAAVHPSYDSNTNDYDIAILRLKTSVPLSSVALPPEGANETYAGRSAVILGWGTTSQGGNISENLLQASVTVSDNAACAKAYGSGINDLKLCASAPGKDTCQGDSGGPLLVDGILVGITSYGYGCAYGNYPGVYARVTALNSWIRTTTFNM